MSATTPSASTPAPRLESGLSSTEAAARFADTGPNEIQQEQQRTWWQILLSQYLSPVIGLLLIASVVSVVLGELADAIAIGAILLINGVVGFLQEYRAERAILALRSLTAPRARVKRDGQSTVIPAREVVTGDVLLLEAGDIIAADAKLVEAYALQTNEAALTGESLPTEKSMLAEAENSALAERQNHVFMGTAVTNGTGVAYVTATGAASELGKIAHLLASAEHSVTPLQTRLASISRTLIWLCLLVVALVAAIGLLRGFAWQEVAISAVSLAVAAIPEGLPAVITIALALGVQRMAAQRVLVRRLHAIETIGCATVVCTDKTGTLTTGEMTVRALWGEDEQAILFAAAACCDAQLDEQGKAGVGDPTELALLMAAFARGIRREEIERNFPKIDGLPFDSVRKRMAVRRANGVLYVKGALESILSCSSTTREGYAEEITEAATHMAQRGLRVLAIATGTGTAEQDLHLLGLVGMADPPRPEAIAAVAAARQAGVLTVMITGDHPITAHAVARELGIVAEGEDAQERVHARATPDDKLHIIRNWKSKGAVVAMTGDGVNDAPALREAHIGIAMGITGTEVTREAADMILTDDNFASIIAGLREGRGIFNNIRKAITYLLAGNFAELAVMFIAALFALPLPLLPLHILWINLTTDGLPALALVTDPTDPDVLKQAARQPSEPLLGRREWHGVIAVGLLQALLTLAVFMWALHARGLDEARNLAFTTLIFGELFRAFGARSPTKTIWEMGLFSNKRLCIIVAISVALQIEIHHLPALQALLHITPISVMDCIIVFFIGLIPLASIELWKLYRRQSRSSMDVSR